MAKYNLWNMAGLDIFLQSLNEKDLEKYKEVIEPTAPISPLKSWGFPTDFYKPRIPLSPMEKDRATLDFMGNQFQWNVDLNDILKHSYDALIVTDSLQNILWTNSGFFEMTGYTASYALGKKPSFLQGALTSKETRVLIKKKLLKGIPFSTEIINYKKNQQPYRCQIQIFPMKTPAGVSHYLALENELL